MSGNNNNNSLALLEAFLKTVAELGVEETTKLLYSSQGSTLTLSDKRVEFVLRTVSAEFKIPIDEMIYSYSKSTKRKFSIMFGIYYLHGHFGISFGDLQKLYKRDKGLLCRYYHEIKTLEKGKAEDAARLRYRDKLDLLVTEFSISQHKN